MEAKDNINPEHYKDHTSLECIEAMLIVFGPEAVIDFCTCNAWKYIWRWQYKNGYEDLRKAIWYLQKARELSRDHDIPLKTVKGMEDYINQNIKSEGDNE